MCEAATEGQKVQRATIRANDANILWVRIYTDEGLVGLGKTFMGAAAVEAYLHEWVAPKLLGKDPLAMEARGKDIMGYLGWCGSGVETWGNSAVDIALWDIFWQNGQYARAHCAGWQKPRCHSHLRHLGWLPVCA